MKAIQGTTLAEVKIRTKTAHTGEVQGTKALIDLSLIDHIAEDDDGSVVAFDYRGRNVMTIDEDYGMFALAFIESRKEGNLNLRFNN